MLGFPYHGDLMVPWRMMLVFVGTREQTMKGDELTKDQQCADSEQGAVIYYPYGMYAWYNE